MMQLFALPAFLALLVLGFSEFKWWVWLSIVIGIFVVSNVGIQGNNFDTGRRLIPTFNIVTIIAAVTALVSWLDV